MTNILVFSWILIFHKPSLWNDLMLMFKSLFSFWLANSLLLIVPVNNQISVCVYLHYSVTTQVCFHIFPQKNFVQNNVLGANYCDCAFLMKHIPQYPVCWPPSYFLYFWSFWRGHCYSRQRWCFLLLSLTDYKMMRVLHSGRLLRYAIYMALLGTAFISLYTLISLLTSNRQVNGKNRFLSLIQLFLLISKNLYLSLELSYLPIYCFQQFLVGMHGYKSC